MQNAEFRVYIFSCSKFYVVRNGGKIMAGRNEAGNGGKKKTRDQARYKHDNDE